MKKFLPTLLIMFILFPWSIKAQTYFSEEGFEHGGPQPPAGWEEKYITGFASWTYTDGGLFAGGENHPEHAQSGSYNALFQYFTTYVTKLISPPINLAPAQKPLLIFQHAMQQFAGNVDELRVYFRQDPDSSWILLKEYTTEVAVWTKREIYLPDSLLSSNCNIAFEAKSKSGAGVCIDGVTIEERGIITKTIKKVSIQPVVTDFIPTGSANNVILRIDFEVEGNNGTLNLENIALKSLNTDDLNIENNGIKLFFTEDSLFNLDYPIGTPQNFASGIATFSNINLDLNFGTNFIWVTYDIKTDVNHEMHGNIADAMIEANSITVSGITYPFIDKSPLGSRTIYESVFFDDFETDKLWSFTGEFERGISLGLGSEGFFTADPLKAKSGNNIIGDDLTGKGASLGNYEKNLSNRQDSAISPKFDAKYYKNIKLSFYRWLNMDGFDTAYIDISTNNGATWNNLWKNNGNYYNDSKWTIQSFNISSTTDRKENIKLRFALGGTDATVEAGGWNIDDVAFTGDFISKDLGITNWIAPVNGCGHSDSESITVTIKNFSGSVFNDKIPLSFSLNGGVTVYRDTTEIINIPIDGSVDYTISKTIDLTTPGWYNNVYVTTNLAGDEDATNNKYTKMLFIAPTYTLPYSQNFESNYGYWITGGTNSSWQYGTPAATVIKTAASGTKAWVTKLTNLYNNLESSYIESPCFNTSGSNKPMAEFKLKSVCEKDKDGLALYYTTDNGSNWNLVPEYGSYNWNWYNNDNIAALGHAGWDTTFTSWTKIKQILPADAANKSAIKFRFVFKSDNNAEYEGFAMDDFKIYETPDDVGVSDLLYPITKCELSDTTHVKVLVKNYGINTIASGTKIKIGLDLEGEKIAIDTLTLSGNLAPNGTTIFQFKSTLDMSYAGDYNIDVFTLHESDPYFYNTVCNDSLSKTITVQGMPRFNPFDDQIGANPVTTVTLDAGVGYNLYSWTLPAPDLTASSQTWGVQQEGWHFVTVTKNASPSNCTAIDSVLLVQSEIDLLMDSLYTVLKDSCIRVDSTGFSVHIINKNINAKVLAATDTVLFGYQINNNPIVRDTLFITEEVAVDDTAWFTFNKKCDLRTPGEYTIKVFSNILKDLNHSNDTITKTINTWGLPDVNLAFDTIYSSQADTLTLDAGSGFANYSWNSGSSSQTETPSNVSYYYKVTVTSAYCGIDKDSTYIETYDFGINNIVAPVSNCEFTVNEAIQLSVHNYSGNTYNNGTKIPFRYNFDNLGWINDTVTLISNFAPSTDQAITLNNTINPSIVKEHSLNIHINSIEDADSSNNGIEYSFETWGYPNVDLAYDTIYTTQADTVVLVATPDLFSYLWNTGSTNDSLIITKNYSKKYYVDVTDEHGCGNDSDTTWIITYDIGASSLLSPTNLCKHTATEIVKIVIKNYSQDTLLSGTKIPVGYIFNNNLPVTENITLSSSLLPGKTLIHTFGSTINLSNIATYNLKLFTGFKFDVNSINDTIVEAIKTFGYPSVELGNDIYTAHPETVSITADPGYITYWWNDDDGLEDNVLNISYPATKLYSVTVTDINGCSVSDNLTVYTYDIIADSLSSPITQCELSSTETVTIGVKNNSKDTLLIGEPLEVGYRLNSGSYVSQSFSLTKALYPDSVSLFTLSSYPADLSINQLHTFKLFAKLTNIDVVTNDTISKTVDVLKPSFDLGAAVNTGNAQYTIDAGAGYNSYEWFNASSSQTYVVDINNQNPNRYYAVTVTNSDACSASDSVMVTFTTQPDLSVTNMYSPESECWQATKNYPVQIQIKNSGVVNLTSGTSFTVGYRIDNGTPVTETYNLTSTMNSNDTRDHTFATQINFASAKIYKFKPFVYLTDDGLRTNDTLAINVDISAPVVDFGGYDTVSFSTNYEIQIYDTYIAYLWNDGSTENTLTVTETGTYSVTVTDSYGCQGFGQIYCKKLTGIENLIKGNGYSIEYFPNPVSDNLTIRFDNKKSTNATIEIINTNGQVVYNNKLSNIKNSTEKIDVSPYANGVYYIRFKIQDEFYVRKLIIQ